MSRRRTLTWAERIQELQTREHLRRLREMRAERRRQQNADARATLGYRAHRYVDGKTVILVDGHAQGLSTPGDGEGRWSLICDPHSGCVAFDTQAEARQHMGEPENWCPYCQDDRALTTLTRETTS
jgi:hypothetical protein